MAKWNVACRKCDFKGIGEELGIDQVVVRVLRNRGLTEAGEMKRFIEAPISSMYDYEYLDGIEEAIGILMDKIDEQSKIRIIGDYDVDGIMSTYILYKGLTRCGADVDTVIPHRIKDGYGISVGLIDEAYNEGIDTIVTCDNGIAAAGPFAHAKELGMTCVITDHHEIPYEGEGEDKTYIIPKVDALVDPKLDYCRYPFKEICGAVVAYKLIEGLYDAMGMEREGLEELLELAGFATVCDVMPLVDENRAMVKYTLRSLKNSHNQGMRALVKVCELEGKPINGHSIGFILGPCINATGRLDSADVGLDLLKVDTLEEGLVIATRLKELNENRKKLTEKGLDEAVELIESTGIINDKVIVAYLPKLHESLAGIVAGRLRERTGKPVFMITDGGDCAKGSARSIPAYHIYEAMNAVKDVFLKFGGHAMAAGFSLDKDRVDEFRTRINELCCLTEDDYEEVITIDVPMPIGYVTENLVEQLSILEPFGNGNEKPIFAQKDVQFLSCSPMGKNGNMARFLVACEDSKRYQAVLFRNLDNFEKAVDEKYGQGTAEELRSGRCTKKVLMDVIYYPSINEYMGRRSLQFILQDFR